MQRDRDMRRFKRSGRPLFLILLLAALSPAVPGINMAGDYWDHYAKDPLHWVKTELEVCRNYHPMFMKMVGADEKYCSGAGADGCKPHP